MRPVLPLLVCLAVLAAACPSGPTTKPPQKETCTNGSDDNGDGKIDCFDPDCFQDPICARVFEDCTNNFDDDRNGFTDCDDPACAGATGCLRFETCDNDVDDNADGLIDCADPACRTQSTRCGDGGAEAPAACADALDNDNDGALDCRDAECRGATCGAGCACTDGGVRGELACGDTQDNDGDSKTDCLDGPDCDGTPCGAGCVCQGGARRETNCTDRLDNDGDSLRDCADTQSCSGPANLCGTGTSEAAACNDTLDNDLNGDRDCEDAACAGLACGTGCTCAGGRRTETACTGGADDDGDGLIDCADPDCTSTGAESCGNGTDDNCNGLVDCADPACTGCTNLAMGAPCATGTQCASGACRTEGSSGWPSGACVGATNGCTLDAGVSYGCPSGSTCQTDQFGRFCRQACSGSGGTSCRATYACHWNDDPDQEGARWCLPLCRSDTDCQRLGGSYGCNPWSKRCETKDKGAAKYGAACGSHGACESGLCLSDEGGYCTGVCRKGGVGCAADGVCGDDDSSDQTGRCFDACANQSECTRGGDYLCKPPPFGPAGTNVCYCSRAGEPCSTEADCCTKSPIGFPPTCFVNFCAF